MRTANITRMRLPSSSNSSQMAINNMATHNILLCRYRCRRAIRSRSRRPIKFNNSQSCLVLRTSSTSNTSRCLRKCSRRNTYSNTHSHGLSSKPSSHNHSRKRKRNHNIERNPKSSSPREDQAIPLLCRCSLRAYDMYRCQSSERAAPVYRRRMDRPTTSADTALSKRQHQHHLPRSRSSNHRRNKRMGPDPSSVPSMRPYNTRTNREHPCSPKLLPSNSAYFHPPGRRQASMEVPLRSRQQSSRRLIPRSSYPEHRHPTSSPPQNVHNRPKRLFQPNFPTCSSQPRMNTLLLHAAWDHSLYGRERKLI